MSFLKRLLFKRLGYMGVVDTQIQLYNRLKKTMPITSDDEILNRLILSRIESPPSIVSKDEDRVYYQPLLDKLGKTLEEVILKIIHYEFIETRRTRVQRIPIKHVVKFQCAVAKYIQEQIRNLAEGGGLNEAG